MRRADLPWMIAFGTFAAIWLAAIVAILLLLIRG